MSTDNTTGTSMPSHSHYQETYGVRPSQDDHYGRQHHRGHHRGDHRRGSRGGRGGGFRRPMRRSRNFVLDFNHFSEKPDIQARILENFQDRMEKGDTQDEFHWAAPQMNDYRVGNVLSVRFHNETEMHNYMVTAKFMRGEVEWKHQMPDSVRFEFRLKKLSN